MWKTTGDVKWRERGWTVFEAIERETKTRAGYSSIRYVDHAPGYKKDDMPSFFLAET
jgi:mannosyl-oligosaccharide alpha-1,2-mannosidase